MTNNWSLQEKKLKKDYTVEKGTEKCLFLKPERPNEKFRTHVWNPQRAKQQKEYKKCLIFHTLN